MTPLLCHHLSPVMPSPVWMQNFSVSSRKWTRSWDWIGLSRKSLFAATWMNGSCWGAVSMDIVPFLDFLVSPTSLSGHTVEDFPEGFTTAQKSSQAMWHFLPKPSNSAIASSHPGSVPTQQPLKHPAPKTKPQQCSLSAKCYLFHMCQGPWSKIGLDPVSQASS